MAFVIAAAQLAFDTDMRSLLEGRGVFAQLAPGPDAVPFGPFLTISVLIYKMLVAIEKVVTVFPCGVVFVSASLQVKPMSSM